MKRGGHVTRSWRTVGSISKQYGPEMMKELSSFVIDQIYAMKATVDKEMLDCGALLTRYMEAYLVQSEADDAKQVFDEQLSAGSQYVKDVNYITAKVVENVSCKQNLKIERRAAADTDRYLESKVQKRALL